MPVYTVCNELVMLMKTIFADYTLNMISCISRTANSVEVIRVQSLICFKRKKRRFQILAIKFHLFDAVSVCMQILYREASDQLCA